MVHPLLRLRVRARTVDKNREPSTITPQRWHAGNVDKIKSRKHLTTTQAKRRNESPHFFVKFPKRPQHRGNLAFFAYFANFADSGNKRNPAENQHFLPILPI